MKIRYFIFYATAICCIILLSSCVKNHITDDVEALITLPEGQNIMHVIPLEQSEVIIKFNSTKSWTASVAEGADWCTLSNVEGSAGDATLTIMANANSSSIERIATVFIEIEADNISQEIELMQVVSLSKTVAYSTFEVDAKLNLGNTTTYEWAVVKAPHVITSAKTNAATPTSAIYSLTNSNAKLTTFLAATTGVYQLKLEANDGKKYESIETIVVSSPDITPTPYISKVFDFLSAVGQFSNQMPDYVEGDTKADIIAKVAENIVGKKSGGMISLGGFGGYVTFGFDHTVINVDGKRDIRVVSNAFNTGGSTPQGSCEPGIIMVAYDTNKNGVADNDEWYEIKGSEYDNAETIKNYEITYFRPETEDGAVEEYIKWEDNQQQSGYKQRNEYHTQSYYPGWVSEDKITFKGTLLPNNAVDKSPAGDGSYWIYYAYGHGYADNSRNDHKDSAFDIGWAVDANGNKVELPGADFMKIYTGVNQETGWLGEVSTEVSGAYDLHMLDEIIDSIE